MGWLGVVEKEPVAKVSANGAFVSSQRVVQPQGDPWAHKSLKFSPNGFRTKDHIQFMYIYYMCVKNNLAGCWRAGWLLASWLAEWPAGWLAGWLLY